MKVKIFLTIVIGSFYSIVAQAQEDVKSKENSEVIDNKSIKEDESIEQAVVAHRVMMGETVMLIAKKYHITPKDIYDLNPDATQGISYNMMINIPADKINKKFDRRATTGHQIADAPEE